MLHRPGKTPPHPQTTTPSLQVNHRQGRLRREGEQKIEGTQEERDATRYERLGRNPAMRIKFSQSTGWTSPPRLRSDFHCF